MFELMGDDPVAKADALTERLREVLIMKWGIKMYQPCKRVELRIVGLDDPVGPVDVALATAKEGGCRGYLIRTGEVHRTPSGMRFV